jgi:nitronate monooxygenase
MTLGMKLPQVIQGGMGVAVSSWRLANAVSQAGQLGVVSGTALDTVLARRLQLGDFEGDLAEAMSHFPDQAMADRVWDRYFISGGKASDKPFRSKPIWTIEPSRALVELTIVGSFVEVWLAKRGHSNPVGINLLEKIQLPTLATLYGAMLAGVDVVLMGAGIPRHIPPILDYLVAGKGCSLPIDVSGGEPVQMHFEPGEYLGGCPSRPLFFAIVASASLAQVMAKKCSPPADGFIVECWKAGGHNAPPRGAMQLSAAGEPIYGERDEVDFAKFRELGLPFWLAGSCGTAAGLQAAQELGAQGIQVGTAFAFCEESGISPRIKSQVIRASIEGSADVFTDPKASPTGFPFKVLRMMGTASEPAIIENRNRICDLGYLREAYQLPSGGVGFRCAAEPVEDYIRKGGDAANCEGRKCVCNGLLGTIGLAQSRKGIVEPSLVTAGDDVKGISRFLKPGQLSYSVADVLGVLLGAEVAVVG